MKSAPPETLIMRLARLTLWGHAGDTPDVIQLGPRTIPLPELAPMGSVAVRLQYMALKAGLQKLPEVVLHEAWNALNAVTKTLDPEAQRAAVPDVRQALR